LNEKGKEGTQQQQARSIHFLRFCLRMVQFQTLFFAFFVFVLIELN